MSALTPFQKIQQRDQLDLELNRLTQQHEQNFDAETDELSQLIMRMMQGDPTAREEMEKLNEKNEIKHQQEVEKMAAIRKRLEELG